MLITRALALTVYIIVTSVVTCNPIDEKILDTHRYLRKYGYLNEENLQRLSAQRQREVLSHAIGLFQEYYGLPGDGELNNVTRQLMLKPRCGVYDIPNQETGQSLYKWPRTNITWNFHLADEETLKTARAAFNMWSKNSILTFKRTTINPDIIISWRTGRHPNTYPEKNGMICQSDFEGPGGTLAHAYYPSGYNDYISEVHVDLTEPWHISVNENPRDTYYLFRTLVHEIGHSLGLDHNPRNDSVMFAFLPDKQYPVKFSKEDIINIRNLYEEPAKEPPSIPTPPSLPPPQPEPPSPDLCALTRVNTILILENRLFISYGRYIWLVDLNGETSGTPVSLSHYMDFLHTNYTRIIGAYQAPSGNIVLFVDNLVYVVTYPEFKLVEGWPKNIYDIGLPANARVNGAVNTHRGRSYVIFNGISVGEIDECQMRFTKFSPIQTIFPGIPTGVTSAFKYLDGNIYFTTRKQYYKFNEFKKMVLEAGKFDLRIINIECPDKIGLLRQLRELLNRIVRIGNVSSPKRLSKGDNDDDDDDDDDDEGEGEYDNAQ